ncbi:MAG TPA: DUF308 domain-containing protein [Intrasporangium sp.]|nr:DUF308 domain-containing protein [Intrasporangium sp.]
MAISWLELEWKHMAARGLIGVVFGIFAMVWPLETAIALVLLWGIWALADGVTSLVQAFAPAPTPVRVLLGVTGGLALVVGVLAVTSPAMTAKALTWVLGIWLLARGVIAAVLAITGTVEASRWVLILSALVDVVLGMLFVSNPGQAALDIAVVLGVVALVWGLALLALAFLARRTAAAEAAAAPSAAGPSMT